MRRVLWDYLAIITIMVSVLKLTLEGYISAEWSAIYLVVLVFFVAAIKTRGSVGRLIRMILRICLPLASLACLVGILEMKERGAGFGVLAILVALSGFYIMFYGLFPDKQKPI